MCACALRVYGEEQREERNSSDSEVFLEHLPLEVDSILCCGSEEQDDPIENCVTFGPRGTMIDQHGSGLLGLSCFSRREGL